MFSINQYSVDQRIGQFTMQYVRGTVDYQDADIEDDICGAVGT